MSFRQFSFLTGPTKLDFVRIAVCTFTSLVGPLSLIQLSFLTEKMKRLKLSVSDLYPFCAVCACKILKSLKLS